MCLPTLHPALNVIAYAPRAVVGQLKDSLIRDHPGLPDVSQLVVRLAFVGYSEGFEAVKRTRLQFTTVKDNKTYAEEVDRLEAWMRNTAAVKSGGGGSVEEDVLSAFQGVDELIDWSSVRGGVAMLVADAGGRDELDNRPEYQFPAVDGLGRSLQSILHSLVEKNVVLGHVSVFPEKTQRMWTHVQELVPQGRARELIPLFGGTGPDIVGFHFIFVLDKSPSMGEESPSRFSLLKASFSTFIRQRFEDQHFEDRVSVVLFSNSFSITHTLISLEDAMNVLDNQSTGGWGTNYAGGLSPVAGLIAAGRKQYRNLTPHLRFLTGK
jgi:hypothetical protein